jgi:uncharacterized protein YqjF (DUF2071 family)
VASWHPTEQVTVPSAQQGWEALTFLHFRYDPAVIATVLPDGLEPDPFDGAASLGITPFRLQASLLPVLPGPRATHVEVNVRTYVRDRDGTDAVWFLSLELDQRAVVTALRTPRVCPTGGRTRGSTTTGAGSARARSVERRIGRAASSWRSRSASRSAPPPARWRPSSSVGGGRSRTTPDNGWWYRSTTKPGR